MTLPPGTYPAMITCVDIDAACDKTWVRVVMHADMLDKDAVRTLTELGGFHVYYEKVKLGVDSFPVIGKDAPPAPKQKAQWKREQNRYR